MTPETEHFLDRIGTYLGIVLLATIVVILPVLLIFNPGWSGSYVLAIICFVSGYMLGRWYEREKRTRAST